MHTKHTVLEHSRFLHLYDPNGRIKNARGLEKDLSEQSTDKLKVMNAGAK